MAQDYKKLFRKLGNVDPSVELSKRIFARIETARMRTAKIYLLFFSFVSVAALAGLIPAFQHVAQQFSQSGFYSYFSLIFSDGEMILTYWRELLMSLAETLPVLGVAIFLSTIFVLLWAMQIVAKNLKNIFLHQHFIN